MFSRIINACDLGMFNLLFNVYPNYLDICSRLMVVFVTLFFLQRMDGIVYDKGSDVLFDSSFVGLGSVSCVKTRIQYFELEGFRGGPAEMDIARGILRHASRLAKFVLSHHKNYSEEDLVEQLEEIKTCIRASEDCIIEVHPLKDSPY